MQTYSNYSNYFKKKNYIPIILSLSGKYFFLKWGKMGRSVNYFANLRAECHFSKIGCNESNFYKKMCVSVIYPYIFWAYRQLNIKNLKYKSKEMESHSKSITS